MPNLPIKMKKLILSLTVTLFFTSQNFAQQFYQTAKIVDQPVNQRVQQRFLGSSVAISSTHILAGSSGKPLQQLVFGDARVSPAYLFALGSNITTNLDWNRPNYIYPTGFGQAVALSDDYAVVGEPSHFNEATQQSSDGYGGVSVFEKVGGWALKQKLLPTDPFKADYFGSAVAIAENQIVVGTNMNDFLSSRNPKHGGVYIFEKDGSNNWGQVQKLSPDVTKQFTHLYAFGQKIAVSGDYMIVSAYVKAYIFKRTAGVWQQMKVFEITAPNESKTITDVAISGTYASISSISSQRDVAGQNVLYEAGAVYIYEKDAGENWVYKQKVLQTDRLANQKFGESIAMDGNSLVVGAIGVQTDAVNGNSRSYSDGAAYVFEKDGNGNWSQIQKIVPSDRAVSSVAENFGASVAIKGNKIVVGASASCTDAKGVEAMNSYMMGATYVFTSFQQRELPSTSASAGGVMGKVNNLLLLSENGEPIVNLGISGAQNLFKNYVEAKVWKQSDEQIHNGNLYLSRNYQITPTNNVNTSTAIVTLYFDQQEFIAFNTNPAKTADFPISPDDLQGIANLRILKISGSSSDGSGLINTYSGTPLLINPDDDKIVWNATANRWEVTFDVTGFSGFFATTEPSVLPVQLLSFDVKKELNYVKLQWKTVNEVNNKRFEVWRKVEGGQAEGLGLMPKASLWEKIGEVQAKPSALQSSAFYTFIDKAPANGNNYYKLVQVDNDGTPTELGVRTVTFNFQPSTFNLYPNPTTNITTVTFTTGQFSKAMVVDISGKVLMLTVISPADNQLSFELGTLPQGTYLIRLIGKETQIQRVVKL